jgi:hypothetical protein
MDSPSIYCAAQIVCISMPQMFKEYLIQCIAQTWCKLGYASVYVVNKDMERTLSRVYLNGWYLQHCATLK